MRKLLPQFMAGLLGGLSMFYILKTTDSATTINSTVVDTESSTPLRTNAPAVQLVSTANPLDIDFTQAAEQGIQAVVHVKTKYESEYAQAVDPIFEFFFGQGAYRSPMPQQQGSGSGVFVSQEGYIVTNNHVIDKATALEVVLNNGEKHNAVVIGTDPTTDLALLKIDGTGYPYLQYGNSDQVKVGQWVLAMGNPFNLTNTVTAGIVSAKGRSINILSSDPYSGLSPIESFIQTDAAVNPGNSGGALVNTNGELIGINTAIKSNTGSYTGYSFAVPVNIVKKVVADLMEFGAVQRAFIGVNISPITEEILKDQKLSSRNGIYVSGIAEDGAAKEAGIEKGDVIYRIGMVEVNNIPELQEQLSKFRPGDKLNVGIIRKNERLNFEITLRNKEGNTEVIEKASSLANASLGAMFEEIKKEEQKSLGINHGLKITRLDMGKLRKAGIKEGFIITHIDGSPIKNTNDLDEVIKEKRGGVLIEGIYPNGVKAYYGLGL